MLTKALPLAREADAPVAMVLMGASDLGKVDQQQIDLTPCIAMDTAADRAAVCGTQTVLCIEHEALAVPRTDFTQESWRIWSKSEGRGWCSCPRTISAARPPPFAPSAAAPA